jgi:Flp pilus assembly protein TadG
MRARRKRALSNDESGVAALEFAIVAPMFIVIMLGILVYGMYFTVAQSVQQLASEAARAAIGGLSDGERQSLALARAASQVNTYPLLMSEHFTVASAADPADPDLFQVTITYDATHLGLGPFSALLPVPADQIVRTSIIRRGGL